MNLRINSNSLRFRLSKVETSTLDQLGILTETVNLGDVSLTFSLEKSVQDHIGIKFEDNHILVSIPTITLSEWVHSNQNKIETTIESINHPSTSIIIEKDLFDEKKRKRKG